jgi:hypothetical protein
MKKNRAWYGMTGRNNGGGVKVAIIGDPAALAELHTPPQ